MVGQVLALAWPIALAPALGTRWPRNTRATLANIREHAPARLIPTRVLVGGILVERIRVGRTPEQRGQLRTAVVILQRTEVAAATRQLMAVADIMGADVPAAATADVVKFEIRRDPAGWILRRICPAGF